MPDAYSMDYEKELLQFLYSLDIFHDYDLVLQKLFELNPLVRIRRQVKKASTNVEFVNAILALVSKREMLTVFLLDLRELFEKGSPQYDYILYVLSIPLEVERAGSDVAVKRTEY